MVRDFPFIKQVFAFEAAVEQRSIFEHGAGDVEEAVTNCEESASMDAAAGSQGQDTGLAFLLPNKHEFKCKACTHQFSATSGTNLA